ncbi:MAG TPA: IS256 family transposase [Lachnospiraceae bacterium]|nr:IS256 family transposase [Lachnospiraceae bacterium]
MSNLNTELMTALLKNESIEEVFRSHLEAAMNELLKIELTQFLGYEKSSILGYNTGNSRNGFYERDLDTSYGRLHIKVPRDRNGHFEQKLIPDYARRTDELETTIITLYKKGITTRESSDLIEKIYGHHYSPATMSNISKAVADQVENFHKRQLSERYAVIFMDATYLNVRRDSVAKEPLHVLLGITPDGTREVLDYALYPTETAANYEEMLESIKKRGVKQVLLFASDGLAGMRDAVKRQFPAAEHQQCWVHLSRTVARYIRNKDRKNVLDDLKSVYRATSENEAQKALADFLGKYGKRYPKLAGIFERAEESLYQFYKFPEAIRKSIYTTNIIERSNKGLKHKSKVKEQFPNEDALDRFVCCYYSDLNRSYSERMQRGFCQASAEILQLFENRLETIYKQDAV